MRVNRSYGTGEALQGCSKLDGLQQDIFLLQAGLKDVLLSLLLRATDMCPQRPEVP
jgi:hypothetical protein